jgi:hypothetical protein
MHVAPMIPQSYPGSLGARPGEAEDMDVGAVSNGRATFEAVRSRKVEPEPHPILVARTGLAPVPSLSEGELLQDDLLRSGLRQRSILHDLDAVLAQREQERDANRRRG